MRNLFLDTAMSVSIVAPVDAAVPFTFQRLSDTQAILTAKGTPDTGFMTGENIGHFSGIVFENLIEGSLGNATVTAGSGFVVGKNPLPGYVAVDGVLFNDFALFNDDTMPSGTAYLTLSGVSFERVGASNRILSNFVSQSTAAGSSMDDVEIGTWGIAAPIPLPAAAWLTPGGLCAIGALSRSRHGAAGPPERRSDAAFENRDAVLQGGEGRSRSDL